MKTGLSFLTAAVLSAFGVASSTPAQTTPVAQPCVTISRTLTIGARGDEVKKLQQFLGVEQTGYFGPLTKQKLTAWQISKKIIQTAKAEGAGTTGPKTRAAMKCASPLPAAPAPLAAPIATPGKVATSTATSSPAQSMSTPLPAGGSGAAPTVPSVSPYGYSCPALGEKPAASSCADGAWEVSADEAGCVIWACLSADDRG